MEKPNLIAEPIILDGKKCWNVGRDPEGKEVYFHKDGFIKLKNGKLEHGKAIDDEGNFVKEKKGSVKNGEGA
jgi:hypothetical protein